MKKQTRLANIISVAVVCVVVVIVVLWIAQSVFA
jgi:hypothetical protein